MSKTELAARLLNLPVVATLLGRLPAWTGLLVLCYHRIGPSSDSPFDRALFSGTQASFDEQLGFLARHFDLIGPADLHDALERPRGRHVLITFDDGYRDNWEHALPVLRSHGGHAAFFVASGFLDRPRLAWWDEIAWMVRTSPRGELPAGSVLSERIVFGDSDREDAVGILVAAYKRLPGEHGERFLDRIASSTGSGRAGAGHADGMWMTWDMVRDLRDAGMEVGGHSVDHPVLAGLSAEEQLQQVAGCRTRLEEELGMGMRLFSYPVGLREAFDSHTRRCVEREGVELAFSLYGGYTRPGVLDPFDIPRTSVTVSTDRALFRATVKVPGAFARH